MFDRFLVYIIVQTIEDAQIFLVRLKKVEFWMDDFTFAFRRGEGRL